MLSAAWRPLLQAWKSSLGSQGLAQTVSCVAALIGTIDYLSAWQLQRELHSQVAEGKLPNALLLLGHPHVYTMGRRGKPSDILKSPKELSRLGVEVHHVDRGGEVTYHGPGQLVGYPIVNLRAWGGGPLKHIRALEEVISGTLAELGIASRSDEMPTGVWLGNAKVAAIGVKVSRGVTTHGFALNVDPDLSYFDHIVPCGMPDGRVTSIASIRPDVTDVDSVVPVLAGHFGRVFGFHIEWASLDELRRTILPAASATAHE